MKTIKEKSEDNETARIEAFSDGVYAIAITLLILDVRVPEPADLSHEGGLASALWRQWPSYLAYVISFLTIQVPSGLI